MATRVRMTFGVTSLRTGSSAGALAVYDAAAPDDDPLALLPLAAGLDAEVLEDELLVDDLLAARESVR